MLSNKPMSEQAFSANVKIEINGLLWRVYNPYHTWNGGRVIYSDWFPLEKTITYVGCFYTLSKKQISDAKQKNKQISSRLAALGGMKLG